MIAMRLKFVILVAAALTACGSDTPEITADAAVETAPTVAETAPQPTSATPNSGELEAVEESDGSFDAEAEAREVTLRMAQEPAANSPQRFRAGEHFTRYQPTKTTITGTDGIEVAEVFWYGCNHCYELEPMLNRWSNDLPADVTFVKMPAVWNPLLETHAQLFYTIEALIGAGKVQDNLDLHGAVFNEIHVNKKGLRTEREIRSFLARLGIDEETFEGGWNSFEVNTRMRQAKSLNRAYQISSVPTMVINGKYRTDEVRAGSKPQLIAVVDELVASER
ncbi:MAG: thiol:disulfide interchange protein DsbA/DsbL [Pseudomonadota bacterium]